MQQEQVAEHAVHHEGHGCHQAVSAVQSHRLRADGIEAVADDGGRRTDADQFVEQHRVVIVEHPPVAPRILFKRLQLGAPFGKAEEQRDHQTAEQQPV